MLTKQFHMQASKVYSAPNFNIFFVIFSYGTYFFGPEPLPTLKLQVHCFGGLL